MLIAFGLSSLAALVIMELSAMQTMRKWGFIVGDDAQYDPVIRKLWWPVVGFCILGCLLAVV